MAINQIQLLLQQRQLSRFLIISNIEYTNSQISNTMIAAKREAFRSQIRIKQIKQMMSKVRIQISKQERTHALKSLIANTQQNIKTQQLSILMTWGIQGQDKAIIHIGNLIIDNILNVQIVQNMIKENHKNLLGSSDYSLWLLHIFYERNHFNQDYLLFLIDLLSAKVQKSRKQANMEILGGKSVFCQWGLSLLKKIITKHASAVQLLILQQNRNRFQSFVKCLANICSAGLDSNITYLSYSIINRVAAMSQKQSTHLLQAISKEKLLQILKIGVLRVQSKIRCICYQLMTNLIVVEDDKVQEILMEIMETIIGTYREQKESVQVQISYVMVQCVKIFTINSIKQLILNYGIIKHLAHFILNASHHQILKNNCQAFQVLANLKECLLGQHFYDQLFDCHFIFKKVNHILQHHNS